MEVELHMLVCLRDLSHKIKYFIIFTLQVTIE